MPARQNYFRLGLFVLAALVLLGLLLFALGGRSLFQPSVTIETYFNESVSGLDVGSPVKFRGVTVGRVSWVGISSWIYQRNVPLDDAKSYIVVRMKIEQLDEAAGKEVLDSYVKRGLRATTQLAGITGQLFVSLDFVRGDSLATLPVEWTPKYLYIPSAPSLTNQIIGNAQSFLASLDRANVQELGQNLNKLVVTLEAQMQQAKLEEVSTEVKQTLQTMRTALGRVDGVLAQGDAQKTLRAMRTATERLNAVLGDPALRAVPADFAASAAKLRSIMESGELERTLSRFEQAAGDARNLIGSSQYDVRAAVEDLRAAAENLRALTAMVSQDPGMLLFSPPPQPVVLPRGTR